MQDRALAGAASRDRAFLQRMRLLLLLICLVVAAPVSAQPRAAGPVAALNDEARRLAETDPEGSLAAARKAQALARETGDRTGEAEAYNFIAYAYRNHSLLDLARAAAVESTRLFVEAGDTRGESQGYNTLGLIEADAGRFTEALEYHLKAREIRERTNDREGLAYSLNNLGNIYRNIERYETALEHHRQALALKVELGLRSSEAYSHHNMGLVYFAMGDHARALEAYRRGLAIREELGDRRAMGVSLNAIGQVQAQSDPAGALVTYSRALALRRANDDERGEMATELNLADVHRRMGNLPAAMDAANRALAIGTRIDAPLMRSNGLRMLAEIEAARGDYRAAYRHQLEHQAARDQMFNRDNADRLHRLQVAYEAESQERRIELLQREASLRDAELARVRTTRTALAVIAVLILALLALVIARNRLRQRSEARLRAQARELSAALDRVHVLKGMLPICAWCKKIRDDNGYWTQVESYVASHSSAEFTHSICPTCAAAAGEPG